MNNKYCKKECHNQMVWRIGNNGSQVLNKMLQARDLIEHQIVWNIKAGTSLIWHDNWIRRLVCHYLRNFPWD